MRNLVCLLPILAVVGCAHGQDAEVPQWTITLDVIDEQNQPVTNASVKVAWHIPPPPDENIAFTNVSGVTDDNGHFVTAQRSGSIEVMCGVEKPGYYSAGRTHEFAKFRKDDPSKWSPTITLMLKRIISPIPMYARRVNGGPPVLNKPVGYDLMAGDWVAPHGSGSTADIVFQKAASEKTASDYYSKITVSLPNNGDGIQRFAVPLEAKGSDLRSTYEAPLDGYRAELTRETSAHPGEPSKFEYEPTRIYLLRVRTVMDEKGNVKSALYGKIYGDFMQFTYYLNPTPNDRNVEFDPKHNLLKGLKPTEQVDAP